MHTPASPSPQLESPPQLQSPRSSVPGVGQQPSDQDLLRAWLAGDGQAGERLFGRYYAELGRYFGRLVSAQESRDLVQETFMNLCASVPKLRERAHEGVEFCPYLFGIARNIFYYHLRRRYRGQALMRCLDQHAPHEDLGPLQLLTTLDDGERLLSCLRELPREARLMIEQYYWDDMTALKLSDDHHIPAATIRTRIFHLKRRLSKAVNVCESSPTSAGLDARVQCMSHLLERGPLRLDSLD